MKGKLYLVIILNEWKYHVSNCPWRIVYLYYSRGEPTAITELMSFFVQHPNVVSQRVIWKWLFPQLCSINKYDNNQYSIFKLSIAFSLSLFCHTHFSFSLHFSIQESHQFLLSSSLITVLEVPLNRNTDWLQDSIWVYYLTLTC